MTAWPPPNIAQAHGAWAAAQAEYRRSELACELAWREYRRLSVHDLVVPPGPLLAVRDFTDAVDRLARARAELRRAWDALEGAERSGPVPHPRPAPTSPPAPPAAPTTIRHAG